MKKKILMLLFVIVIGILCSKNILQSHSLTPPVGNTGAPGETTCAQAGCHGGSGTGGVACTDSLIITSEYLGEQYRGIGVPTNLQYVYMLNGGFGTVIDTLTFIIKLPTAPIAGFQMTATAGSFMIVDTSTTQISVSAGKQYISHKNSTNGSNSWKFKWYPNSSTTPNFYFSTVCDTASISGGSGGGGSCVPGCTGSSSSGAFGSSVFSCSGFHTADIEIRQIKNGVVVPSLTNVNGFCVGDTVIVTRQNSNNCWTQFFGLSSHNAQTVSYLTNGQIYTSNAAAQCIIEWDFFVSCLPTFPPPNSPLRRDWKFIESFDFFDKPVIPNLIDKSQCVAFGDTIGLVYNPSFFQYRYSWSPTIGLNNPSIINPIATVFTTTSYELTVSSGSSTIIGQYPISNPLTFSTPNSSPSYCNTKDTQTIYVHQPTSANTSTTICKNELYLFNGKPYSSAGTFKDTLVNYNGCDSITTLNLNVRTDEPISVSGVVCKGGRFIFNGKMYDTSGVFTDTIFSNTSCDTVYTLTLSTAVIPVDTSVTAANEMLIAHATNSTFQWYDCVNQSLVQGATDDTLLPPQSGYYSVIITTQPELCSDTSACKFIFTTGINSIDELKQTKLFPNPVHDELKIQFSKTIKGGTIKILNLNGAELMNQSFNNKQFVQFSTKNLAAGIYVVEVQSGNSVWHQKMVKQ